MQLSFQEQSGHCRPRRDVPLKRATLLLRRLEAASWGRRRLGQAMAGEGGMAPPQPAGEGRPDPGRGGSCSDSELVKHALSTPNALGPPGCRLCRTRLVLGTDPNWHLGRVAPQQAPLSCLHCRQEAEDSVEAGRPGTSHEQNFAVI